jgi:hypothetical protein
VGREQAVVDARIDELRARLGELGADQHRQQPADEEEEEGDADVLDPDHLVIGVEVQVIPPRIGAVVAVVVGDGRGAGRPAQPVVAAADPEQEADRGRDRRDDDVRVAGLLGLDQVEAADRAQGDDEPEAEQPAGQRAEEGAAPSGAAPAVAVALVARTF